mmetsp:Transcript_115610/g.373521  ORF Transcript_115610/g.373521 Transcript_115610/m.373521 type:complete len:227 (+) Transcript_115610:1087-1767(+)
MRRATASQSPRPLTSLGTASSIGRPCSSRPPLEPSDCRWCTTTPHEELLEAPAASWPSAWPAASLGAPGRGLQRGSALARKGLASDTSKRSSLSSGRMRSTGSVFSKNLWSLLFHTSTRTHALTLRPQTSWAAASRRDATVPSLPTVACTWIVGPWTPGAPESRTTVNANRTCCCSAWLTRGSLAERKGSNVTEVRPHLSADSGQRTTDLKRPMKRSSTLEWLRLR